MIELFAERKQGIAATALAGGRQRVGNAAATLTRRGRAKASAELCNEAVGVLIRLCYEADTDGSPVNVDTVTARILIPLPWGERGHRRYGLRSTEQRALRRYMFDLQSGKTAPLFSYESDERSWYLNPWDYSTSAAALAYWEKYGMTTAAYKERLR